MPKAKTPVSPFPGRQFDSGSVRRFHWNATRGEAPFETWTDPMGPNGAVVISFTAPARVGTKVHLSIAAYAGDLPEPQEDQYRAVNVSATELDFVGATVGYDVSPSYEVVANDGDKASRGYLPMTAGADLFFNIANLDPDTDRGEVRVQCSI